jgi:hypothetical protein
MSQLTFRPLQDQDYETICDWWKWWRWPIVPKENLPNNGTGGFMVQNNNIPIVCGFVYITNSNLTWLEFIVSNPEYRQEDRRSAIKMLMSECEKFCVSIGKKAIFSIGRNKHLLEIHKELGWTVDKKPSYEIVKTI